MITKETALKNVRAKCEARIRELFPTGIPDIVAERLEQELAEAEKRDYAYTFEMNRIIMEAAEKTSLPVFCSSGTLITFLFGGIGFNPLPAYYYCPVCGRFETDLDYKKFGIDLPEKRCECGAAMISDGIGIPFDNTWNVKRTLDLSIRISKAIIPYADKALKKAFGNEHIIPMAYKGRNSDGTPNVYWSFYGYALLTDINKEDLEDEFCWLEDGEPCLNMNYVMENKLQHISVISPRILNMISECQSKTGIFASGLTDNQLKKYNYTDISSLKIPEWEYSELFKPQTKAEMSRTLALAHITTTTDYSEAENREEFLTLTKKLFSSERFEKYPFAEADDMLIYLVTHGVASDDAINAAKLFVHGKASDASFRDILSKYDFPDDFFEATAMYRYLFPRANNAIFVKCYLILAWYAENYKKSYTAAYKKFTD